MSRFILLSFMLLLYAKPVLSQHVVVLSAGTENEIRNLISAGKSETFYIPISLVNDKKITFEVNEVKHNQASNYNKYSSIKTYKGNYDNKELSLTISSNRIYGFVKIGDDFIELKSVGTTNINEVKTDLHTTLSKSATCERLCKTYEGLSSFNPSHTVEGVSKVPNSFTNKPSDSRGDTLKIFNLVLTVTGKQNQVLGNITIEDGMAYAMNLVNFVNATFQREMAVGFKLHPHNEQVIYLDPANDPYPENQVNDIQDVLATHNTTIFSLFDPTSFDTGLIIHPSTIGRGGGRPGSSARGYVGSCACYGLVLHELAHHLGAQHSNHLDRSDSIENLQLSMVGNNNTYLHSFNFENISNTITTITVGTTMTSGNSAPLITDITNNLTIPKGTAFVLSGSAVDPDPSAQLTYTWQHMQGGSTEVDKLLFAHQTPDNEGNERHIPSLKNQLNGSQDMHTNLPNENREIIARFVVRDNQLPAGGVTYKEVNLTVDGSAGPFKIIEPNTISEFYGGTEVEVHWDVAQTDNEKINVTEVDILLSTDEGVNWISIDSKTANDGHQIVRLPNIGSTTCRFKVAAVGNIFYDISDTNFSIYKTQFESQIANVIEDKSSKTDKLIASQAVTPNGDGINDHWIIKGIEKYPENKVQLYNREGKLVFQRDNYTNYLSDTSVFLSNLPNGMYYYQLEVDSHIDNLQGWLLLNH